jgi:hypothetical protein
VVPKPIKARSRHTHRSTDAEVIDAAIDDGLNMPDNNAPAPQPKHWRRVVLMRQPQF